MLDSSEKIGDPKWYNKTWTVLDAAIFVYEWIISYFSFLFLDWVLKSTYKIPNKICPNRYSVAIALQITTHMQN